MCDGHADFIGSLVTGDDAPVGTAMFRDGQEIAFGLLGERESRVVIEHADVPLAGHAVAEGHPRLADAYFHLEAVAVGIDQRKHGIVPCGIDFRAFTRRQMVHGTHRLHLGLRLDLDAFLKGAFRCVHPQTDGHHPLPVGTVNIQEGDAPAHTHLGFQPFFRTADDLARRASGKTY